MLAWTPGPWIIALLCLMACAAAAGIVYFWHIIPIGCAYRAKAVCSALFVSGRTLADVLSIDVSADSYRIMRLFPVTVDAERKTVGASFLGVCSRTAVYRPGLGATLTAAAPESLRPTELPRASSASKTWETAPSVTDQAVVDAAFKEVNPKRLRRTRAIVVIRDGRITAEQYAPGMNADMPLPGWSMSKSVLGLLIGARIREGALTLERQNLLPQWGSAEDPRSKISVDDLLRMQSGLSFAEVYTHPLSDVSQMLFNAEDTAAVAASRPSVSSPGEVWQYSSGTTNILSRILRGTFPSDEAYHAYPRKTLFDPLGMTSAVFETDAAGTFVGSSFLFATARDWASLGLFCLEKGVRDGRAILPEDWMEYATTPTPRSPNGIYGAHWWLRLQKVMGGGSRAEACIPQDAYYAIGHEGQVLTIIPSLKMVVVRLGMSIHIDAWNHARFMADLLAGG